MLSYIELRNFKSFSDITLDLRKAYGEPKKIAFIYGENGSGKSNLISSVLFLLQSFNTLLSLIKFKELSEYKNNENKKSEKRYQQILQTILHTQYFSLNDMIKEYKMLGSEQNMSLKYGFRINSYDGSYLMEFTKDRIVKEELRYQINEREGIVFSLSQDQKALSPTIFPDVSYKKELYDNIEKYWGKHTFMAIINNEIETKNDDYIEARISKNLMDVIRGTREVSVLCKNCIGETSCISIPFKFMMHLGEGSVEDKNDKQLKLCESVLNTFFTQLYTDIKSVYYSFTPEDNVYSYELCFRKIINGRLIDIPISLESTGTRQLLDLFPMLFGSIAGKSVCVDEIDSGIHDLLMKTLTESLVESIEGQLIATTHNTLLMECLPTEYTYIIRVDVNGNKSVDCVADYKQRTQKTNNMRSKYLRGDYEGIPYTGYLDLKDMVEDLIDNITSSTKEDGDGE